MAIATYEFTDPATTPTRPRHLRLVEAPGDDIRAPAVTVLVPRRSDRGPAPRLAVRRRRTLLGVVVAGLIGLAALPAGALGGHGPAAAALRPHQVYVVQPGDTLWSVAQRLDPAGDPRVLVSELTARLGSDRLVAGERLRLP